MAGAPIAGLDVPTEYAFVRAVGLETDDAVDDISVSFDDGWTALIQAKRSLDAGASLSKAATQWVAAVKQGVNPAKTRLVIASGRLSGTMHSMRRWLQRQKLTTPAADTGEEQSLRAKLREKLSELDDEQFEQVLKVAVIWEVQAEQPEDPGAQVAIGLLRTELQDPNQAMLVWGLTLQEAGRVARLRGGNDVDVWLAALRAGGANFRELSASPAGLFEQRESALDRYCLSVRRRGWEIDLRSLGAALPNVALAEADADVRVERSVDGHIVGRPLTWAFLRRVRCVLTGLPGAGKSTAMRRVAADLCAGGHLPIPLLASLREVNALDHSLSFRDRLLAIALKDCTASDREVLRTEFEVRLDGTRPVAVLLDALDETYDHRAEVISDVQRFTETLDPGVPVLLSTRDVAYAYAETLGWPQAKLMPPANSGVTIGAILRLAAPTQEGVSAGEWIEVRQRWVNDVLASDSILRETPLILILLTLLATRSEASGLPHRRADVLRQAVDEVVTRRELRRSDGHPLGRLEGSALPIAGLHAFAVEARTLMDHNGSVSLAALVEAVGDELRPQWDLAPGDARAASLDAIRLFDESGIFTIGTSSSQVTPRIVLFAEIGDAMHAVANPTTLSTWTSARIAADNLESVVLACALDPATAGAAAVEVLRATPSNAQLARALARAIREGAALAERERQEILSSLIESLHLGTDESWDCWDDLLEMCPPTDAHEMIIAAARSHSEDHALVAETTLALRFTEPSPEDLIEQVRKLMTLSSLPKSAGGTGRGSRDFMSILRPARSLATAQSQAAGFLAEHSPENVDLLVQRIMHGPAMLADPLTQVLVDHGFDAEVREIVEARTDEPGRTRLAAWIEDHEEARESETVEQIAGGQRLSVRGRESVALDSLASLLQALRLEDYGDPFHAQSPAVRRSVYMAVAKLLGLDMGELATEASILLERMGEKRSSAPFDAMFDPPVLRQPDWARVDDPDSAVHALVSQFLLTTTQATVAARFLWATPQVATAARLIRDLIPKLHSSPEHERLAAHTLASLSGQPEPSIWLNDPDPVLRTAAANMTEFDRHRVDPRLALLLDDLDGHVQEAAIDALARIGPPGTRGLLEEIAERPEPGWECLSCRTLNSAGSRECQKPNCFRSPPHPSSTAQEALSRLS